MILQGKNIDCQSDSQANKSCCVTGHAMVMADNPEFLISPRDYHMIDDSVPCKIVEIPSIT